MVVECMMCEWCNPGGAIMGPWGPSWGPEGRHGTVGCVSGVTLGGRHGALGAVMGP